MNESHTIIKQTLDTIREHAGQPCWRHTHDQATHIEVALKDAGFKIVRQAPQEFAKHQEKMAKLRVKFVGLPLTAARNGGIQS